MKHLFFTTDALGTDYEYMQSEDGNIWFREIGFKTVSRWKVRCCAENTNLWPSIERMIKEEGGN